MYVLCKKWNNRWIRVYKINNLKTSCPQCPFKFNSRSSYKFRAYYCSLNNMYKRTCQRMNKNFKTINLAPKKTNIL